MIEFEKVWAEKVAGYNENNPAHRVNKATAKQFWEAALEWVKSWLTGSVDDTVTKYLINQELLSNQANDSSDQSTPHH